MSGILGAVILFNPDEGILQHVGSYIDHVDQLLVIDNSEPSSLIGSRLLELYKNVTLVQNPQNLGIAHALNQAASFGLTHKFAWLLTMDQDSNFQPGSVREMISFLHSAKVAPGILTPFHLTPGGLVPTNRVVKEVRITMTSGNLLNLEAYRTCGDFDEKLFIDSVDHEYCLRLRKAGYKIVRLSSAVLNHRLGDIKYHHVLWMRFKTTNHTAQRKYYITRNRLYVMVKYFLFDFKFFTRELRELIKSFWTVILFEKNKTAKLASMLRGTWHFVIGHYGKV